MYLILRNKNLQICAIAKRKHNCDLLVLIANEEDIITHCDVNIKDDDNDAYTHTHVITVAHVKNAIHKMKSGKSDCIDGILSDNFKEDTDSLYTLISLLFSSMLMHGLPPAGLLMSSLVPILKNKRGNKCDSENYRQIAISSLMGKLFDSIVLEEQQYSLFTDLLQFGSKKSFHCYMYVIVKRNN